MSVYLSVSLSVCIYSIFSQTLEPTRLKFSGGDRGHPGMVYGKFGKDWSKIPPIRLFQCLKKGKNGTLARKTDGTTGLKLGMDTQLDSGSNIGWVPPGHTSSSLYVGLKMPKIIL